MPSDSSSQGGRRPFHRGRRGHDRRSGDRRGTPSSQPQAPEQAPRGDKIDVEQIMREIRSKIAERHGVELTDQQVQELAARRLESILDLRTIRPSLVDELRRSAGARPDSVAAADRVTAPYEFEDTTLFDSPSGLIRAVRRLLQPVLKLLFNPNPLIRALHIQSRLNVEAARRDAERDERQAEWNALHYEILHRIVTETARVSLEVQSLALRVESLSAKIDFNERRVRGIEGAVQQARPGGRERERDRERDRDREREALPAVPAPSPNETVAPPETPAAGVATAEAPRRRRRRRRGRRGGGAGEPVPASAPAQAVAVDAIDADDLAESGEGVFEPAETAMVTREPSPAMGPEHAPAAAPERVTPQLAIPDPAAREHAAPDVPAPEGTERAEGTEETGSHGDTEQR